MTALAKPSAAALALAKQIVASYVNCEYRPQDELEAEIARLIDERVGSLVKAASVVNLSVDRDYLSDFKSGLRQHEDMPFLRWHGELAAMDAALRDWTPGAGE